MNRHEKHLRDLLIAARDVTPVASARIAAAVVSGNRVISYGVNSRKTSPLQKKFGKNDQAICIHAEISAIKNALNRNGTNDLSNSILYVARAKKEGKAFIQGIAKPCEGCMRAIAAFNLRKVFYTEDNTGYTEL